MKNKNQQKETMQFQPAAEHSESEREALATFIDGRPEAAIQRKIQQQANAPVQRQENKTGLPDNLKSGIENLSGLAMDDVRVHRNSDKPAQLNAHAYAQGTDIHLAAGQEKHLPHEAWHVVQQKQGRVKPTMQMKGKVAINDDAGLEREADLMGRKAMSQLSTVSQLTSHASADKNWENTLIQRKALSRSEREQLTSERERFRLMKAGFSGDRGNITDNLALAEQNLSEEEIFSISLLRKEVDFALIELDEFFFDTERLEMQAMNSQAVFSKFIAALNWYEKSGGRNKVISFLGKTRALAKGKTQIDQRTVPGEVDGLDEKFFSQYLKMGKPVLKVYRGDGRGIGVDALEGFRFTDIEPGGTRDISYYGMVEHQHTNTAKNGMVSTSSSFDVAHFWATQKQKYGVVYEMEVDDYLHVANLLQGRNFKDRYADQFEILVPGKIPASKVKSATLYNKKQVIKKVTN